MKTKTFYVHTKKSQNLCVVGKPGVVCGEMALGEPPLGGVVVVIGLPVGAESVWAGPVGVEPVRGFGWVETVV